MDHLLSEAWLTGNEDNFTQVFHLISSENVSGRCLGYSVAFIWPLNAYLGKGNTAFDLSFLKVRYLQAGYKLKSMPTLLFIMHKDIQYCFALIYIKYAYGLFHEAILTFFTHS